MHVYSVLWLVALLAAALGAAAVSAAAWERYQTTPSMIAMERDFRVWNTSAPAGTLCPHIRVDPEALERVVNR